MARDIDLYNRYTGKGSRIPNIGIGAGYGGFAPATFTAGVYTPQKEDMSLLQRSIATLDERKENVDKQRAAIRLALNQLTLNEAEDKWKDEYIDNIIGRIDAAAQFGDYSAALETATDLAAKAATDPNLTARVRANEQYQQKRKEVEAMAASGRISDLTKERWLAQSQYRFVPTLDANDKVVGGKNWLDVGGIDGGSVWNPVARVDLTKLAAVAEQFVKPAKGSKYSKAYTNGSGGGSSHSYQRVTEEELDRALTSVFNSTDGAEEALEQDYKDKEWKLSQLELELANASDADRSRIQNSIDDLKSQLYVTDIDGKIRKMSTKEYMTAKISPALHEAAYEWKDDASSSALNQTEEQQALAAGVDLVGGTPWGMQFNSTFRPFRAGSIVGLQSGYSNPSNSFTKSNGLFSGNQYKINGQVNSLGIKYNFDL